MEIDFYAFVSLRLYCLKSLRINFLSSKGNDHLTYTAVLFKQFHTFYELTYCLSFACESMFTVFVKRQSKSSVSLVCI